MTGALKTYCLQSHFDFTVYKGDMPHFAVEFDGPSHREPRQVERDRKKDEICRRTDLPLLRINAEYLHTTFGMTVLRWLVDVHELEQGFLEQQERGHIAWEEPFCPFSLFTTTADGRVERLPYYLSAQARIDFQRLARRGVIVTEVPTGYVGLDEHGNRRGFEVIRVERDGYLITKSGIRSQLFPTSTLSDLVVEVMTVELHTMVKEWRAGTRPALRWREVEPMMCAIRDRTRMVLAHTSGKLVAPGARNFKVSFREGGG